MLDFIQCLFCIETIACFGLLSADAMHGIGCCVSVELPLQLCITLNDLLKCTCGLHVLVLCEDFCIYVCGGYELLASMLFLHLHLVVVHRQCWLHRLNLKGVCLFCFVK